MPILSIKFLATNNGEVRYRTEGGEVVNLKAGGKTAFISANGVYIMRMFVPTFITLADFGRHMDWTSGRPEDVPRRGDFHDMSCKPIAFFQLWWRRS